MLTHLVTNTRTGLCLSAYRPFTVERRPHCPPCPLPCTPSPQLSVTASIASLHPSPKPVLCCSCLTQAKAQLLRLRRPRPPILPPILPTHFGKRFRRHWLAEYPVVTASSRRPKVPDEATAVVRPLPYANVMVPSLLPPIRTRHSGPCAHHSVQLAAAQRTAHHPMVRMALYIRCTVHNTLCSLHLGCIWGVGSV